MAAGTRPFRIAGIAGWAIVILSGTGAGCDGSGPASPASDAAEAETAVYDGPPGVAADTVVSAPGAGDGAYQDPVRAVNGVRGGGDSAGSTDVFSLGFDRDRNDVLVLRWSGRVVRNGPGSDVVVAENAFRVGSTGAVFMDPAIVSVSRDGISWVDLPHAYRAVDPTAFSADPADWQGFAGVTPVRWNVDTNDVDPFDRMAAGGDAFDLDDLPEDGGEADAIRVEGFRFLRIRSAATEIDPGTGAPYPHEPSANGPDIDGVAARYLEADDSSGDARTARARDPVVEAMRT